ncbi:MAG TPA: hypothetical protein VI112_00080, partial [Bacteroidia bacterium]
MKKNYALFIAVLFLPLLVPAQSEISPGSMKDLSPVFYDMTRVTPEQVKQMNEEHHRMMLRQDPHWDEKRAQFEQQVQV